MRKHVCVCVPNDKMKSNETTALLPQKASRSVSVEVTAPHKPRKSRARTQPSERIKQSQHEEVRRRIQIVDAADVEKLNIHSHHVRTTPKKKASPFAYREDEYNLLEESLISSIQITEALENDVNRQITIAYQKQQLRVPIIAFMRCGSDFEFVQEFERLSNVYDIVHTKNPTEISKKQLSLDLLHHEPGYKTIVSVILYLESLNPPLSYVISRYPVTFTPKVPDLFVDDDDSSIVTTTITTSTTTTTTTTRHTGNNVKNQSLIVTPMPAPSFIERLYLNCVRIAKPGYYYHIYIDLSLTTPEPL